MKTKVRNAVSTTDPCKLCTPLGAALAFHGLEGGMCLLHGSQGCSTYIRRYLISHFKEPIDIASTNFSEQSAVFGGRENFFRAMDNLESQYAPEVIGVATTCLAETMGEDLSQYLAEYQRLEKQSRLVTVSTPSYKGTHSDGFHQAVKALVQTLGESNKSLTEAAPEESNPEEAPDVLIFPGMASPADLRGLKALVSAFGRKLTLIPDISTTLDGGQWSDYQSLPSGGTPLAALRLSSKAHYWLELGDVLALAPSTAGTVLASRGVKGARLGYPIGIRATDRLVETLTELTGKKIPPELDEQRSRLADAYADAHKVLSGLTAAVYGEEDLVVGLVHFLSEVGVHVTLAASGGASGHLEKALQVCCPELTPSLRVLEDADFFELEAEAETIPDLLIGSSKGYSLSRRWKVPLLRVGFPLHDRFGGARVRLFGYEGTLELFDRLVNTVLEQRQTENPVGYTYY